MVRVIIPITRDMITSNPAPTPDANHFRNKTAKGKPPIQTIGILIKNIQYHFMSNSAVSGITARMNPLIHGIALIKGTRM